MRNTLAARPKTLEVVPAREGAGGGGTDPGDSGAGVVPRLGVRETEIQKEERKVGRDEGREKKKGERHEEGVGLVEVKKQWRGRRDNRSRRERERGWKERKVETGWAGGK